MENYLYDKEIMTLSAAAAGSAFDEAAYDGLIKDIRVQDVKELAIPAIRELCVSTAGADGIKLHLATFVSPETAVFAELKNCIFD
jgi:hypothetical protein